MTKKQTAKMIAFIVTVVILVVGLANILNINKKEECVRLYGYFKEPKGSIDVTLIGSSELYRGYFAPLAYDEGNFTSYAISLASMPASLYEPILRESIKKQDSQLYVIEINGVYYDNQMEDVRLREWFDNIPMSRDKIKEIKKLIPEDDQSSYYINFEKYHSNWDRLYGISQVMLDKNLIKKNGYACMKGYYSWFVQGDKFKREIPKSVTPEGKKYLEKFMKYCKDEKIDNILFVRWPHRIKNVTEEGYSDIDDLIKKYGFDFMNFDLYTQDIGIDFDTDFADDEHLNPLGTEKITRYFAKYIKAHYDLDTKHDEDVTKEWNSCRDDALEIFKVCLEKTRNNEGGKCWTEREYKKILEEYKKKS